MYCCRDTLKSNSIVIGCQQHGQANSYSISMTLVYTSFAIHQISHEIQPVDACIFLSYRNSSAGEQPANDPE
jgi:hypothetical protein